MRLKIGNRNSKTEIIENDFGPWKPNGTEYPLRFRLDRPILIQNSNNGSNLIPAYFNRLIPQKYGIKKLFQRIITQ